jgi:hypothetical protein
MAMDMTGDGPQISVNKLGEYMTAKPLGRRRIVLEQKRPRDEFVPRYAEARQAIALYLAGGATDEAFLLSEMQRLAAAPAETEWDAHRNRHAVEAIEAFMDLFEQLHLEGCEASLGAAEPPPLEIAGVSINVRPEVLLRGSQRNGQPLCGALKFYFSQTSPLSRTAGHYAATAVFQFVHQFVDPAGAASHRHCQVVDVFAGQIYTAPRFQIRRRQDLEAACEEIARTWSAV